MPRDTLWPLAKNCVKYSLVLVGGRMLYNHSIGALQQHSAFVEKSVKTVRDVWVRPDWLKFLVGVALLAIVHFVLRGVVRKKQQLERLRPKPADAAPKPPEAEKAADEEDAETGDTGNVVLAPLSRKTGFRVALFFIRELPKIILGTAGAVFMLKGWPFLDYLYMMITDHIPPAVPGIVRAAGGFVLLEAGYAIITRGIRKEHGPLLRFAHIDDRRMEGLHWDTMKIRGFGVQMQTRATEGIIEETTPTADVTVKVYTAAGVKKSGDLIVTYLKNLEPVKKRLPELHIEDIQLVKEALKHVLGAEEFPSSRMAELDVDSVNACLREKTDGSFKTEDLARVLVAMERVGSSNILGLKDSQLLDAVNDNEMGFEGGLFSRTLYKRDEGGRLTPLATMVEDLTLTDQISSSVGNGYGPDYWRRGKVLMGFKFFRGYGEDGTAMRTVVHEIRKSRLRRYWDYGDSYLWTFKEKTFFIDNSWMASLGWLIPGPWTPKRKYIVRDSSNHIIAHMNEIFVQKLLFDMDWNIHVYDDRLNFADVVNVLALLTEFLHYRRKYQKARTAPGNSAHERLLVSGGRKRGDTSDSLVGGI